MQLFPPFNVRLLGLKEEFIRVRSQPLSQQFLGVETSDMQGNAGIDIFAVGWNGLGWAILCCDQAVAALFESLRLPPNAPICADGFSLRVSTGEPMIRALFGSSWIAPRLFGFFLFLRSLANRSGLLSWSRRRLLGNSGKFLLTTYFRSPKKLL